MAKFYLISKEKIVVCDENLNESIPVGTDFTDSIESVLVPVRCDECGETNLILDLDGAAPYDRKERQMGTEVWFESSCEIDCGKCEKSLGVETTFTEYPMGFLIIDSVETSGCSPVDIEYLEELLTHIREQ